MEKRFANAAGNPPRIRGKSAGGVGRPGRPGISPVSRLRMPLFAGLDRQTAERHQIAARNRASTKFAPPPNPTQQQKHNTNTPAPLDTKPTPHRQQDTMPGRKTGTGPGKQAAKKAAAKKGKAKEGGMKKPKRGRSPTPSPSEPSSRGSSRGSSRASSESRQSSGGSQPGDYRPLPKDSMMCHAKSPPKHKPHSCSGCQAP